MWSVVANINCTYASEVEVALFPADDPTALVFKSVGNSWILAMHHACFGMDTRRLDCGFDVHIAPNNVRHDLHDCATQSRAAGAANDQPRSAILQHNRRGHHRR